jgi:hypothetical protein
MTLTIDLSPQVEAKLRERAAASGRDAAQYVAEIVEEAVSRSVEAPPTATGDAEQQRLHEIAARLLTRAQEVVPDADPPRLTGRKAEFEQAVVEKFRRQGLRQ